MRGVGVCMPLKLLHLPLCEVILKDYDTSAAGRYACNSYRKKWTKIHMVEIMSLSCAVCTQVVCNNIHNDERK